MTATNPPQMVDYPVTINLPVLWGDQDALGHVNNTVPFRWFESARIAYFERSGMGELMAKMGLGTILASVSCNYLRQLHYPDHVQTGVRITRIGSSSLSIEQAVYSESLQAIAAEGQAVVVTFDYDKNQTRRVPDEIRAVIESIEEKKF